MQLKTKKTIKRTMIITLSTLTILLLVSLLFFNQAKFGRVPSGERKERIKRSFNYKEGKFQNRSHTPQLTGEKGLVGQLNDFLFGKYERVRPLHEIPSVKTDLLNLDRNKDVLVWFGHSSYFIQIDGKRILVDPVFSNFAGPISSMNKAYAGTNVYSPDDIPDIDYLLISHDHWDHLDYETVQRLKNRTSHIICGLGVGEHFEYWGFDKEKIIELDWQENSQLGEDFVVYCLPARHFSGRGVFQTQSLWASFLLQTPSLKIYMGGDSGYDTHFAEIGEQFGEIDLAILENGQYDAGWKYIHMMPHETVKAAKDLHAKRLLPVHSVKFSLANHPWDEPLTQVAAMARERSQHIVTPRIGEPVNLKDSTQAFSEWWREVDK